MTASAQSTESQTSEALDVLGARRPSNIFWGIVLTFRGHWASCWLVCPAT
jgi:hypothetical protein